jgi:hypothetical protein
VNRSPDNSAVIVVGFFIIYALPTIIALRRKHSSLWAIAFVNWFLGFTVIGWGWALIWSLASTGRHQSVVVNVTNNNS